MSLLPFLKPSSCSVYSYNFVFLFLVLAHIFITCSALLGPFRIHRRHPNHQTRPVEQQEKTLSSLFEGNWVRDDSYPLYNSSDCPVIDPGFNCQSYGRPDSDYLRYRWRPANYELPRFNGIDFLVRMRGKTVMFVGDSLGRNQWESLICMIFASIPQSPTQMVRREPLSTFYFLEFGVAVSFYRASYLVDIDDVQGKRILRLGGIRVNGDAWKDADVLSFNSGHWWSHTGSLKGWDYVEWDGTLYSDMDRLAGFELALRTWAKWIEINVDPTRTKVFFQSISPTHYGSDWNSGAVRKSCYGETMPMGSGVYSGPYDGLMKVVQSVMKEMRNQVILLDITTLSTMRKDAHPSIYGGGLNPDQRANPDRFSDCSHWCLPGLPDTWNQVFYTVLFFSF